MNQAKPNLFDIARANAPRLEHRVEKIRSDLQPKDAQILSDFMDWFVGKARISINMPPAILAIFSRTGIYQNIHAWAEEKAKISDRQRDQCLQEKLGNNYDRRMAFDGTFKDGYRFVYAAVNTGGIGTSKFGIFCAVLTDDLPSQTDEIAYIVDDSLSCCFAESGNLCLELLSDNISPHTHRHYLAALKHAQEVVLSQEDSWQSLIVSDACYIETILGKAPVFSSITEVRLRRENYDELWELAFANFGRKLSDADKALVLDFSHIIALSKQGSFILEVLQ